MAENIFLVVANTLSTAHFIDILKAFSLFKKWQQSNMKLLIAAGVNTTKKDVAEKKNTYKYKDDVVLLANDDEAILAKIMAAAYCVLYPQVSVDFNTPIVEALQVGVPVIATNDSNIKELAAEAAIYINANSPEALAEKMQLIYKDEILRSKLINTGLLQAKKFNWNTAIEQVWSIVEKVNN